MSLNTDTQPPSHKQLHHWVTDQIRAAILAGEISPGEWLRQERLAQQLNVSQMPVREALKQLAAEGLVEHIPYRGVRVIQFSPEDVEDIYAHRSFLEGRAAHAAAHNITAVELIELHAILESMRENLGPATIKEYRELNRRFHQLMAEASRRDYLIRTLIQLWGAFPAMLLNAFAPTSETPLPGRESVDLDEHAAILAALEARDAQAAERLVREHIENSGRQLLSALRKNA